MEEGHNIPSQSQPHLSPRGTPIPTSPGDALESLPSPQSAPRSTPSSTPVSLRYHFAVYGACSSDSSANPSDNLVSGYLYCSQLVEETQTRLKIRGVTLLESGQSWSRRHLGVGAELLEVATPPQPATRPFSLGSTHEQGFLLHRWKASSTLHSHRCRRRPGDPALAEGVPDLRPRKVVLDREPRARDHPARPGRGAEDQDPAATRCARPQPPRTARAHGHAERTCRRPAASPRSPVAAPTPAPSPPPPAVCARLPRTPASSTAANSNRHFAAAPRLRVPGATSAKACALGWERRPGEVPAGSCSSRTTEPDSFALDFALPTRSSSSGESGLGRVRSRGSGSLGDLALCPELQNQQVTLPTEISLPTLRIRRQLREFQSFDCR